MLFSGECQLIASRPRKSVGCFGTQTLLAEQRGKHQNEKTGFGQLTVSPKLINLLEVPKREWRKPRTEPTETGGDGDPTSPRDRKENQPTTQPGSQPSSRQANKKKRTGTEPTKRSTKPKNQRTSSSTYPLKLQGLGKLIFYRHIAHVTQQVEQLCFLRGKSTTPGTSILSAGTSPVKKNKALGPTSPTSPTWPSSSTKPEFRNLLRTSNNR